LLDDVFAGGADGAVPTELVTSGDEIDVDIPSLIVG